MVNRKTMNTIEATNRIREAGMTMSEETLRCGLKRHVFPFGIAIPTDGVTVYHVSRRKLEEWIADFIGG